MPTNAYLLKTPRVDYEIPMEEIDREHLAALLQKNLKNLSFEEQSEAAGLALYFESIKYARGELLFEQGHDHDDTLYLVIEGFVEITKTLGEMSRRVHIATFGPGEIVGELRFLDQKPRSASCIAKSDVLVGRLSKSRYFDMLKEATNVAALLHRVILVQQSARLRTTTYRMLYQENS